MKLPKRKDLRRKAQQVPPSMIVFIAGVMVAASLGLRAVQIPTFSQPENTPPPLPPGLEAFQPGDLPGLHRLNDQQLQVFMNLLGAVPQIPIESQTRTGGNYYSLQHANWPPLPGNTAGEPIWQMNGFYLINDLNYDYDNPPPHKATSPGKKTAKVASGMRVTANVAVPGPGGSGGGGGTNISFSSNFQVMTTNDLWLQITGTTNTGAGITASLVIHSPWNVTNGIYDLFATSNLLSTTWQYLGRCSPGQTNLTVTGLIGDIGFFRLGTTNDTDGDGLTDAYERLVSHTDPASFTLLSSDGVGTPDAWYLQNGINPLIPGLASQDSDQDGLVNYQEYLYGTQPMISEGFAVWAASNYSNIP